MSTNPYAASHHGIADATATTSEVAAVAAAARAWAGAINAHDTRAVAALYDPDAILYATFDTVIDAAPALAAYFERLFKNERLAVAYETQTVRLYAENVASASGLYAFSYVGAAGDAVRVVARYSFVYVLEAPGTPAAGQWLVVEHHSSVDPA